MDFLINAVAKRVMETIVNNTGRCMSDIGIRQNRLNKRAEKFREQVIKKLLKFVDTLITAIIILILFCFICVVGRYL